MSAIEQFRDEVLKVIRGAGWPDAHRPRGGHREPRQGDIVDGPEWAHFEVQEELSVPAIPGADVAVGDVPVLVHRSADSPCMATVPLADLLGLLRLREHAACNAGAGRQSPSEGHS